MTRSSTQAAKTSLTNLIKKMVHGNATDTASLEAIIGKAAGALSASGQQLLDALRECYNPDELRGREEDKAEVKILLDRAAALAELRLAYFQSGYYKFARDIQAKAKDDVFPEESKLGRFRVQAIKNNKLTQIGWKDNQTGVRAQIILNERGKVEDFLTVDGKVSTHISGSSIIRIVREDGADYPHAISLWEGYLYDASRLGKLRKFSVDLSKTVGADWSNIDRDDFQLEKTHKQLPEGVPKTLDGQASVLGFLVIEKIDPEKIFAQTLSRSAYEDLVTLLEAESASARA